MKLKQLGPYRIKKQIGKGGMGAVYEATSDSPGPDGSTRVAIKALSPQLAMADGFRERFEAEIESLKKLKHAGIVRLYGYGEQDGILFYSMELVDGPSLEEEIRAGRRFDWRETLQIGIQTCRALKHAHDHGVVHRDIKPANLMLAADNQIKIADFGIARLFGGTQLTTAGGVLGTADYMSPEQADGTSVTDRCDQYSLGGVMYALLAGRPPFSARTMPEMLQLQRFAEPDPVRRYASDTPDQLERLITQLLSKDPAERFPNVLVLSRHMEAMEKALSRRAEARNNERAAADDSIQNAPKSSTTVEEASPVLEAPVILPHDTSQATAAPNLYDAPTLDQPFESEVRQVSDASLVEPKPASTGTTLTRKSTHFTTVDEDARRQQEQNQDNRLSLAVQLGGLLATLALLLWGGWQLMKPPTATELFASIKQAVDTEGLHDLSRETTAKIESFLTRFPNDPRTQELQPVKEQLAFQKYERQARARSRFTGATSLKPIEIIYFEALAIAETNPSQAIAQLQALVDLYDPLDKIKGLGSAKALAEQFEEEGDPRLLIIAKQRIKKLHSQQQQAAKDQLPTLRNRLVQAARLKQQDPAKALRMYRALIKLYENQAWAVEAVDQAKKESEQLADELNEDTRPR